MSDKVVEPEGSIEIQTAKHGIEAKVTLFFVFEGDWSNMYDDVPANEEEARAWFVHEVQAALDKGRNEARESVESAGQTDSENRGE